MWLNWLVAHELTSDPGRFYPVALFPHEEDAVFYLDSVFRPAHPDRNYIIRQVDSEKDIYKVCYGKEM